MLPSREDSPINPRTKFRYATLKNEKDLWVQAYVLVGGRQMKLHLSVHIFPCCRAVFSSEAMKFRTHVYHGFMGRIESRRERVE